MAGACSFNDNQSPADNIFRFRPGVYLFVVQRTLFFGSFALLLLLPAVVIQCLTLQ